MGTSCRTDQHSPSGGGRASSAESRSPTWNRHDSSVGDSLGSRRKLHDLDHRPSVLETSTIGTSTSPTFSRRRMGSTSSRRTTTTTAKTSQDARQTETRKRARLVSESAAGNDGRSDNLTTLDKDDKEQTGMTKKTEPHKRPRKRRLLSQFLHPRPRDSPSTARCHESPSRPLKSKSVETVDLLSDSDDEGNDKGDLAEPPCKRQRSSDGEKENDNVHNDDDVQKHNDSPVLNETTATASTSSTASATDDSMASLLPSPPSPPPSPTVTTSPPFSAMKAPCDSRCCWSCEVLLLPPASTTTMEMVVDDDDNWHNSLGAWTFPSRPKMCYVAHAHPLLDVSACAACATRALAMEDTVQERLEQTKPEESKKDDKDEDDLDACCWCVGRSPCLWEKDEGNRDDELLLCDSCPRVFCLRCVALANGEGEEGMRAATQLLEDEDEPWLCLYCRAPRRLQDMQQAFAKETAARDGDRSESGEEETEATAEEANQGSSTTGATSTDQDNKDEETARLVEKALWLERAIEEAEAVLEDSNMEVVKEEIDEELPTWSQELSDLSFRRFVEQWQDHHENLIDTKVLWQEALEAAGITPEAFHDYRKRQQLEQKGIKEEREGEEPEWKKKADARLSARDAEEEDARAVEKDQTVYRLELKDLKAEDVEDICPVAEWRQKLDQSRRIRARVSASEMNYYKTDCLAQENETLQSMHVNPVELERKCFTDEDDVRREGKRLAAASVAYDERDLLTTRRRRRRYEKAIEKKKTDAKNDDSSKKLAASPTSKSKENNPNERDGTPRKPAAAASPPTQTKPSSSPSPFKPKQRLEEAQKKPRTTPEPTTPAPLAFSRSPRSPPDNEERRSSSSSQHHFPQSSVVLHDGPANRKVTIAKPLAKQLKTHQVDGVQFMWKLCFSDLLQESKSETDTVSGCILAHCMGLGKSLQVVSLLHTLLTHPLLVRLERTGRGNAKNKARKRLIHRVLLIVPLNIVGNWENEFRKWKVTNMVRGVPGIPQKLFHNLYLAHASARDIVVSDWKEGGGVLCTTIGVLRGLIGDDAPAASQKKRSRHELSPELREALCSPDLVVIDEAHQVLRNNDTAKFKAVKSLSNCKRRIALSGTPFTNKLREYYHMCNWVKPGHLGTLPEFDRKFVIPIMEGMASDCNSDVADRSITLSRELHSRLKHFVQRRDKRLLAQDLPPMQQVVLHVRQSRVQRRLLQQFRKINKKEGGAKFLEQYSKLRPVCNHPGCLKFPGSVASRNGTATTMMAKRPTLKKGALVDLLEGGESDVEELVADAAPEESAAPSAAVKLEDGAEDDNKASPTDEQWWSAVESKFPNMQDVHHGGKGVLLLHILAHADILGDKVVIFSQCVKTMNFIEHLLQLPHWEKMVPSIAQLNSKKTFGEWRRNVEYHRIDGATTAAERKERIDDFNDEIGSQHSKAFLISKAAGGIGTNLTAANRVIMFDSHFNPAEDLQAIFRCYRYGQTKPVCVYRLLTEGTMEEKVYSRSVNKTGVAARIVDNSCPERAFTKKELEDFFGTNFWVMCDDCGKWRMLPPEAEIDREAIENHKWFCRMNSFDPDRSNCDAAEIGDEREYERIFNQMLVDSMDTLFEVDPLAPKTSTTTKTTTTTTTNTTSTGGTEQPTNVEDWTILDQILSEMLQVNDSSLSLSCTQNINDRHRKPDSWISHYYFHESLFKESDDFLENGGDETITGREVGADGNPTDESAQETTTSLARAAETTEKGADVRKVSKLAEGKGEKTRKVSQNANPSQMVVNGRIQERDKKESQKATAKLPERKRVANDKSWRETRIPRKQTCPETKREETRKREDLMHVIEIDDD